MSLVKKIQNFSFTHQLWEKGDKIILAVSGGPDSLCLLDVFAALKKKYSFELLVAHVNYNLRGQASQREEALVRRAAQKHGLAIEVLDVETIPTKGNLEQELRNIRYAFFQKLLTEKGFDKIATGHNRNDQAETLLLHLLRGAGLQGLSAMKPRNAATIRPLLETERSEIVEYLKERKISYGKDSSNADISFVRNRIRHKLIPYLQKDFSPAIIKILSGLSFSLAEDYEFIQEKALKYFHFEFDGKNKASFRKESLEKLPLALQRQALRNLILLLKKDLREIESSHIEELLKTIRSSKGKTKKVQFQGLKMVQNGATITLLY